jgi:hypothetical protein
MMLRVHPLGRENARFSNVVPLRGFGFCCIVGFGFEGLSGFELEGLDFLLVWNLSCILHVYLEAPNAF